MRECLLVAVLTLSACKMSCFAPAARQIDAPIAVKLNEAPENASARFDHSALDGLVARHARTKTGRVDYAGLSAEAAVLDGYVMSLGTVTLEALPRDEQKALLINAYNAFTLKLILENYPRIASIKDLPSPWKQRRWNLAGDTVSLDDIEHGLLRPTYKDPRIHFAVNCASVGCPPLADSAFTGDDIEAQLDAVTRATLNNPRYADVRGGSLHLTSIMSWYGDDFSAAGWSPRAESVAEFVAAYRDDVPAAAEVEFLDYDWDLNNVSAP